MSSIFEDLLKQLTPDRWRASVGFSQEMVETQAALFNTAVEPVPALTAWLEKHQPCLFGRMAAKKDLLRYCILREGDLQSEEHVIVRIQDAREQWSKDAFDGKASGFVILLISQRVADAVPDEHVLALSRELCRAYLRGVDIKTDFVHHEKVYLEKPGPSRTTWEWHAGVNYFCAQGDKRWWNDHRIPGGLAFSVNSVGHMAKAGRISQMMNELNAEIGAPDDYPTGTIASLDQALGFAMLTIDNASIAVSGKATELSELPTDRDAPALPACPVKLPPKIANKNHCTYSGWYHTDYTLPSEYFRPDVERPGAVASHALDFTYLFLRDLDNPDHDTMGVGRRIRDDENEPTDKDVTIKRLRMEPREVPIDECPMLLRALRR